MSPTLPKKKKQYTQQESHDALFGACFYQVNGELESTDAAPEVPHPSPSGTQRPTRLPARRSASGFFFFFFSQIHADSTQFAPTRLDSCQIGFDSHQTGLIRPKWGCIRHIRSYRLAADTAETGRKRPKSALNMVGKAETCLLLYFFCESRHSNVFFKNILIVKIYRKYK